MAPASGRVTRRNRPSRCPSLGTRFYMYPRAAARDVVPGFRISHSPMNLSVFSRHWRFDERDRALGAAQTGRAGVHTRARSMALGDALSTERRVGLARGRNVRGEHRSGRLVPDGARWRSAVGPARASGSRWRSARVCSGRWTRRPPPPRPPPRRHHHRRRRDGVGVADVRERGRHDRRGRHRDGRPERRSDVPLRGARAGDGDGGRGGGGGGGGGDVRREGGGRREREGAAGVHAQRRAGRHRVGARGSDRGAVRHRQRHRGRSRQWRWPRRWTPASP